MVINHPRPTEFPGKLICVEGLDGSGKSTQVYLLKRWLELDGYKVFFTEWNSSPLVEEVTKKAKKRQLLTPTTFALIHSTDFADRYERQLLPLLHAGYIVLCDRYIFTAFARDGVRGCDPTWSRSLYSFAQPPDLTLWFKIPVEVSLKRVLERRPTLKYYEAGMDMGYSRDPYDSYRIFQGAIHNQYEKMVKEFGFHVIDADRPADRQQQEVRMLVDNTIQLRNFKK